MLKTKIMKGDRDLLSVEAQYCCQCCSWGTWCQLWWLVCAVTRLDSNEYGRYHLLQTSRLLVMTDIATLTYRRHFSLVDTCQTTLWLVSIGGGQRCRVVFIRCVDTWHIYRFSSSVSITAFSSHTSPATSQTNTSAHTTTKSYLHTFWSLESCFWAWPKVMCEMSAKLRWGMMEKSLISWVGN